MKPSSDCSLRQQLSLPSCPIPQIANALENALEDCVVLLDSDTRILFVNQAAADWLEQDPAQCRGKLLTDCWPEASVEAMNEILRRASEGRPVKTILVNSREIPGKRVGKEVVCTVVTDQDGRHAGFFCIARNAACQDDCPETLGGDNEARLQTLAGLNRYTTNRIEKERKTLASELHDELGSVLTLMSFELDNAINQLKRDEKEALEKTLSQINELVKSIREYKHRVVSGLRPPLLQELGLEASLQTFAEEFCGRSKLALTMNFTGNVPPLAEEAALAFFRAVQESLTNIAKYARASAVQINLKTSDDALHLEIVDNGCGLPLSKGNGFGLIGIRERMHDLGGDACFERLGESGGTRVSARIPLDGNIQE